MVSQAFLTVDDQPITLAKALQYLQTAGKLKSFVADVVRQYVIEQELQTRQDLDVNPALIEQAVIDFRLQHQLTDPKVFANWLVSSGKDYRSFHASVTYGFKLEKLKVQVTEPKLQEHFIERKLFLDRVVLSRIIVAKAELAEELASQIEEGASFEQLAAEYSITDDRIVNGMMGPVSRGSLPDVLRAAIDSASLGKIVKPLAIEGRWGLFRVEQFLPASLEDPQLKQALQNELFERWVAQTIQKMTIKLNLTLQQVS
jgi:parvulin-like peptidyl-prolyl isomerase